MDTPPIPRLLDGKIENWSPCAKGTVRIWMSWAAPGGASVAPGRHADPAAGAKEDERPMAALVRPRTPPAAPAARSPDPLRLDAAGRRGVAEPAAPLEHIGEGVPR